VVLFSVLRLVVSAVGGQSVPVRYSLRLEYLGVAIISVKNALVHGQWHHIGMDYDAHMEQFR
jgi:hypothetical protein